VGALVSATRGGLTIWTRKLAKKHNSLIPQGLKKENGDIVQHWFVSEVTPEYGHKEWVGKCKFYYVVDPKTNIIKSWGIDEGGNPESCRIWP